MHSTSEDSSVKPGSKAVVPSFDFMSKSRIATIFSSTLVAISLASLIFKGLVFGLDFTSGVSVRLGYSQPVAATEVSELLEANGISGAQVVNFGSERDIRIILQFPPDFSGDQASMALETGEQLQELLSSASGQEITLLGSDFVSAKAGAELAEKAGMGLLVSFLMIMVYISVRFQFKFAVGAVVALIHDVIITLGFFSLFGLQFDLTVLAAVLAVIGYSINDTIIVADRIRENFRRIRKGSPLELINLSINQTLSRTLITSGTTLIVVLVMLFLGGDAIRGFSIALTIGIVVGTYSSIYIASAALLYMNVSREDLMLPVKEDAALDSRP